MSTSSETSAKGSSEERERPSNFIREIIDDDLAAGRHTAIVTRFPPEPNGLLHIGHAKAICLNFGIARDYDGRCNLRFDDTNPTTERTDYVRAIEEDIAWLGFEWGEALYASDYFDRMYAFAEQLVERGLAYVDSLSADAIREYRGTPYEPGRDSPYRERTVEENLDLFRRMKAGEFPEGAHVLRAKIDMSAPNIVMRDTPLYRIKHASHHRTGDAWCIYPMYDFAHCLEDAIEGVTHSLCTLEFENNREIYDWIIDNVDAPSRPRQIEFARLGLGYTVMSKRKLLQLVEEGHVEGWDDPRMPTLSGFRRRGVRPEAIRALADLVGVAKTNSLVDVGKLEFCIRDDLNTIAPRRLCVLRPLKVVVTTWADGEVDELDAPSWPADVGRAGSRVLPFTRELCIERDDFAEDPPKGWKRLAPGREVRLRHGYVIRCDEVVKDAAGEVVELRCSHDPRSRGGDVPDGRKISGTIHWVSADRSLPCEVRLVDRLFGVERPGATEGVDFLEELNPESLVVLDGARVEPAVAGDDPETRFQFERQGYFWRDPKHGRGDALVFNRIVTLKDGWARARDAGGSASAGAAPGGASDRGGSGAGDAQAGGAARGSRTAAGTAPTVAASHLRDQLRADDEELAARYARYTGELGVASADADVLTGERALSDIFEAALAAGAPAPPLGKWIVHELIGRLQGRDLDALPFDAAAFARLVVLVDDGTISAGAGKEVLATLVADGGDPEAIVEAKGLRKLDDADALAAAVAAVVAAHPDEAARYKGGEQRLLGFFIGQVMAATGGAADPKLTRELLAKQLA